jgi:hypothetical protein
MGLGFRLRIVCDELGNILGMKEGQDWMSMRTTTLWPGRHRPSKRPGRGEDVRSLLGSYPIPICVSTKTGYAHHFDLLLLLLLLLLLSLLDGLDGLNLIRILVWNRGNR